MEFKSLTSSAQKKRVEFFEIYFYIARGADLKPRMEPSKVKKDLADVGKGLKFLPETGKANGGPGGENLDLDKLIRDPDF